MRRILDRYHFTNPTGKLGCSFEPKFCETLSILGGSLDSFDELLEFTEIKDLYIDSVRISTVNLSLVVQLTHLTELGLENMGLESLPAQLWQLQNLRFLQLSNNKLSNLPMEFSQLRLCTLVLDLNCFEKFPMALEEMSTLQILHIGNNYIKHLPNANLQLRNFYARNNQIVRLPRWVKNSRWVDMWGNPVGHNVPMKAEVCCDWVGARLLSFDIELKYLERWPIEYINSQRRAKTILGYLI